MSSPAKDFLWLAGRRKSTAAFRRETAEHRRRGYGMKEGADAGMREYARRLREEDAEKNPYWPGIPCWECREHMAVEGSFFCPRC